MSGLRGVDLRKAHNVRAAGMRSARQGIVRGVPQEGDDMAEENTEAVSGFHSG